MDVVIGVDSHKRSLAAAVVDALGALLEEREFQNSPKGHLALLAWLRTHQGDRRIGIECSGSYGAKLASCLLEAGEDVREVPTSHAHRERRRKRAAGKSDPVDAVAIARVAAREADLSSPKRSPHLGELKLLCDYRDQLTRTRTQITNRLHIDLVIAHPEYSQRIPNLRAKKHLVAARQLVRGDHSVRAELIRTRISEISRLNLKMADVEKQIEERVAKLGTGLTSVPGVGPFIAAKILGEVGDISRVRSKASFALLSGTAPLPASSGSTTRHRLNRTGNRQLNWALHFVALAQQRVSPEAQAYMARQREMGKSYKEGVRCLKRHLSNVIYRELMKDQARADIAA
ncbi:MAG: IS110 family transposase [Actinomycetota bacterium]|nr:IS110 family transposase [Actinomycetota bacterium]